EGPDVGKTVRIDGTQPSRLLVGQGPACDIRLTDRRVSRRHAALDLAGSRVRVVDLGSTNGTFIDGVAVVDAFLRGGETLRLGSTAIRVEPVESARVPALSARTSFGKTVGASAAMRRLYPLCERLAASDVTLVIEGETGTGKEVLAESLHEEGPRRDGPFVVFDCTAVAPNLVESELFGHEKGAFTGAISVHRGVFEQAHGGTLFIDEIGDLDLALQAKLLRVLQRSEVRRVGGDRNIPVDVRVLAATRRNLDQAVQAGRFRDDLFFRLAVARIELPALRDRHGDIEVLANHFWSRLGGAATGLPYETARRFDDHGWPGNVRELHNAVARLIALGNLAPEATAGSGQPNASGRDAFDAVLALDLPLAQARARVVDAFERRYLEHVLNRHGGNVRRAAEASGIARRYFQILRARAKDAG
ncbi:MAG: sigma 54-dependent Fis family transcriptional regulator, partial [Polyangiaceae bacterium]|nr:sigma 54-dependent Fis family transcriptional regulator [Polyangiaceae bacterium]